MEVFGFMSHVSLETRLRWADEVLYRNLEGESVLVSLVSSKYFGLDEVGTRVWELIGEHRRLKDVLDVLLAEYEVEEERMQGDLLELVQKLLSNRLVSVDGEQPPS